MLKRTSCRCCLLLLSLLPLACGGERSPEKYKQKMVILGFDGMDPRLVEKWMGEGKLPNFQRLAGQGGFYRLQTSTSPESPTSWASFAIGGNAGKHNIFDFLVRDVKTYVPDLGMVQARDARLLPRLRAARRSPKITTLRGGTSFWVTAGQAGVRSAILTVPVTFPPEDVPGGRAALRAAAARHPRHGGHLLLLRHRPEPLRRRQHGDGRHPQAA